MSHNHKVVSFTGDFTKIDIDGLHGQVSCTVQTYTQLVDLSCETHQDRAATSSHAAEELKCSVFHQLQSVTYVQTMTQKCNGE